MKRKLIATLLALATAGCCTLGFTACADEPETPPEKQPEETITGEVTEEQWKTELANLKGLGEFKNYTIDFSGERDGSFQYTIFVDFEKPCVYNDAGFYCGIENIHTYREHTVCDDYYVLQKDDDDLWGTKDENLDYDCAYTEIMCCSLLITLQNIKSAGETIDFENAYEIFTYDAETKSYSAKDIEVITESFVDGIHTVGGGIGDDGSQIKPDYIYWSFDFVYEQADMEIAFKEDCYTVKLTSEDWNYEITIRDFNNTVIELPEDMQQKLQELK